MLQLNCKHLKFNILEQKFYDILGFWIEIVCLILFWQTYCLY